MAARDWFGVAVRIVGLYFCLQAIESFYTWLAWMMGTGYSPMDAFGMQSITTDIAAYYFGFMLSKLILGIVILVFAPAIVNLAYGSATPGPTPQVPTIEDL